MSNKNELPIESLERQIRQRFPNAKLSLDAPKNRTGTWFLDLENRGHSVILQWREGNGFGVSSSPSDGFGEGPDEIYQDEEAAYGRVVSLMLSRGSTSPPKSVRLRELRNERGITQVELAELLQKQQGEVSKIEHRSDMLVSTLRDVVRSLGGTLQIVAKFPDGNERSVQIDDMPGKPTRHE